MLFKAILFDWARIGDQDLMAGCLMESIQFVQHAFKDRSNKRAVHINQEIRRRKHKFGGIGTYGSQTFASHARAEKAIPFDIVCGDLIVKGRELDADDFLKRELLGDDQRTALSATQMTNKYSSVFVSLKALFKICRITHSRVGTYPTEKARAVSSVMLEAEGPSSHPDVKT